MSRASLLERGRALWRGRAGKVVRIAVLGALAMYLLHTVDLGAALDRARRADPTIVLAAVVVLTAVHLVAALNWRAIVVRLGGGQLTSRAAVRAYYASQALGGITPGNLGGDAYRVVNARAGGGGWAVAALAVLVQRATSFAALAALGGVALAELPSVLSVAEPLLAASVALALVLAVPGVLILRRTRRAGHPLASGVVAGAALYGFAGGLAFHAIAIGASYALVVAVDPSVGGLQILAAVALARLSLAVPIAPSGIGVQEGAVAALFVLLGASPETAVAASLLGRLALLATTAIGLALVAQPRPRTGRIGPRGAECAEAGSISATELGDREAVVVPQFTARLR